MQMASISKEDQPACSVLLFYADDDLNIYFATHADSQKIQNLREHPKASVAIWSHGALFVQADVVAEIIEDTEKVKHVLDMLAERASDHDDFWPPVFRIKGDGYAVVKLTPTRMRAMDLSITTMRQESQPFTQII